MQCNIGVMGRGASPVFDATTPFGGDILAKWKKIVFCYKPLLNLLCVVKSLSYDALVNFGRCPSILMKINNECGALILRENLCK